MSLARSFIPVFMSCRPAHAYRRPSLRLTDGEQVAIAVSGAPTSASSGSAGSGPAGLINLNTATAEQLDTLPGVGPALAKKIIDWRSVHHRFDSVEKLREVSGIGPAKYDELKALVTV
jgi:competence protein ComEA